MYQFVDRPVVALGRGGKFLLWAMRGWMQAMQAQRCPPGMLAPAFARHGALAALPHLHQLMTELNRAARQDVSLRTLRACTIGDDEAVLLQLWSDAQRDPPRAQATLALLVDGDAAGSAFAALLAAATCLGEAGLDDIAAMPSDAAPPR